MDIIVFYSNIVTLLRTAVVGPVISIAQLKKGWENVSNTLNFKSSVNSVTTVSQLATGILRLEQKS